VTIGHSNRTNVAFAPKNPPAPFRTNVTFVRSRRTNVTFAP